MGIFDGVLGTKQDDATPDANANVFSSGLYDAIYNYAKGSVDKAKVSLQSAILGTAPAKSLVATAERQELQKYLPIIVLVAVALFFFGFVARR